jgi:hypothetical protein
MFEILTVIVLFLLVFSVFVLLPILFVIKAAQFLFERPLNEVVSAVNEVRDHHWRNVDAVERENMVRKACGWRVIGRVVGGGRWSAVHSSRLLPQSDSRVVWRPGES